MSEWTVETLREHLNEKLTDTRDFTRQQISDLRDTTRQQAEDHRRMLDERYATQTKALDAAFKAAEQAVAVALSNAEKATTKAETAADKRFDAVNEFRQVLSDQTSTFLPRVEYEQAHGTVVERISSVTERVNALELRLTSRLDTSSGASTGAAALRTDQRLNVSNILQAIAVIGAIIGVILVAFHH